MRDESDQGSAAIQPRRALVGNALLVGFAYYYLTSSVIFLGMVIGYYFMPWEKNPWMAKNNLIGAFTNWDGESYQEIATSGYSYDPEKPSNVAFFPAYPLSARCLTWLTGFRMETALLLIAHFSLAGTFVLFSSYLRSRLREVSSGTIHFALLSFGLLPTTVFLRMAYSESLFTFCVIVALYGMERNWPLWIISATTGLATCTRPLGIALGFPLALHIVGRYPHWGSRLLCWLVYGAFACWGLFLFMGYQWMEFGDPLAFVKTQNHWRMRPFVSASEKWISLVTLEPLVSAWVPSSPCYWRRFDGGNPFFSLYFANPLWWLFAIALTLWGCCKGWLNAKETSLSAVLLFIPYATRSHEMCMGSMGRFAAVALPIYVVMGRLLQKMPFMGRWSCLAVSAVLLAAYAAFFASWHLVF